MCLLLLEDAKLLLLRDKKDALLEVGVHHRDPPPKRHRFRAFCWVVVVTWVEAEEAMMVCVSFARFKFPLKTPLLFRVLVFFRRVLKWYHHQMGGEELLYCARFYTTDHPPTPPTHRTKLFGRRAHHPTRRRQPTNEKKEDLLRPKRDKKKRRRRRRRRRRDENTKRMKIPLAFLLAFWYPIAVSMCCAGLYCYCCNPCKRKARTKKTPLLPN